MITIATPTIRWTPNLINTIVSTYSIWICGVDYLSYFKEFILITKISFEPEIDGLYYNYMTKIVFNVTKLSNLTYPRLITFASLTNKEPFVIS